jgi:hypothetical protein
MIKGCRRKNLTGQKQAYEPKSPKEKEEEKEKRYDDRRNLNYSINID